MTKKYFNYLPHLIIFIASLLPLIYTYGKLTIGGDVIIPFTSDSLRKYLYHWVEVSNGEYFAINYIPYYLLILLAEKLHLGIYNTSGLLLFLLNSFAGIGFYRLASYVFPSKNKLLYSLPVVFFIFSPALLNAPHYLFSYTILPWVLFPFFKFYISKNLTVSDILVLALAIFWGTMELPNPKYVFHLHIIGIIIVIFGSITKQIKFQDLVRVFPKTLLYLLLTTYIWLPQIVFAMGYSPREYDVTIKNGSNDNHLANYGIDTANKVFKLHQDYVFLNSHDANNYTQNKLVQVALFIVPLVVLWSLLVSDKKYKKDTANLNLLSILIAVYLFFALGPNPPTGLIYEYLVKNIPLLAFLRTTAGAVFYLSIFYGLVLTWFFVRSRTKYRTAVLIILFGVLLGSWPLINGAYYRNFNDINPFTDTTQNGVILPSEYGMIMDVINSQRLDSKTLHPDSSLTYLNTSWGFFGPVIYNFLYSNRNIGIKSIPNGLDKHNIGFVYYDRSLMEMKTLSTASHSAIVSNRLVEFQSTSRDNYLPHLILSNDQPDNSVIEYRKINPTKYQLRLHKVTTTTKISFLERYHELWKIYKIPINQEEINKTDLIHNLINYRPLLHNENDQPPLDELKRYIQIGWITDLGSQRHKAISHYDLVDGKKKLRMIESYQIDFISQNYAGTIQNNNLRLPTIYQSIFERRNIINSSHSRYENYGNTWTIDLAKECELDINYCQINDDGTYDINLIINFWPQSIYELSLIISLLAFILCLLKVLPRK